MSNRKFLPKTVQKMKEGLEGRRKATERRVLRTVADVDRIIKGIPTQSLQAQLELFDAALRGQQVEGLNPELAKKAGNCVRRLMRFLISSSTRGWSVRNRLPRFQKT